MVGALGLGGIGIALDLIGKALMAAGIIKFLGLGPMLVEMFVPLGVAFGDRPVLELDPIPLAELGGLWSSDTEEEG